jgi:hypothetical protein
MTATTAGPAGAPGHGTPRRAARRWQARVAAVTVLASAVGLVSLVPGAAPTAAAAGLVPWADCDAMTAHYRAELAHTAAPWGLGGGVSFDESGAAGAAPVPARVSAVASSEDSASTDSASTDSAGTGGAVGSGLTGTNLQEAGVDEPDTAKLSGDLLVTVAAGRLQVLRGGATPALLSSVPLGADAGGSELLVDGSRVLVVTTAWRPVPGAPSSTLWPARGGWGLPVDLPMTRSVPAVGQALVRLLLVDLATPAEPRTIETLELDGSYVSARLVDGTVRLVTRSTPDVAGVGPVEPYGPQQEQAALEANRRAAEQVTAEQVLPLAVRRGPTGEELSRAPAVDCTSVHAPVDGATARPRCWSRRCAGRRARRRRQHAVTTDGDLVHASPDRLHVATSRWGTVGPADATDPATGAVTTQLHAFDTSSPDRTRYVGTGSVDGYLSGRWAMSRHEGHLRVATTTEAPWDGSAPSSSSVVVLAEQGGRLVERGRLDGLGLTERIYAVRWFGDLATVVTFRQTDPLYVLDVGDPARPRLLGELKVPGFSTYLHPVGDDRLLGVGQDADASGRVTGFSLALFDVSDPDAADAGRPALARRGLERRRGRLARLRLRRRAAAGGAAVRALVDEQRTRRIGARRPRDRRRSRRGRTADRRPGRRRAAGAAGRRPGVRRHLAGASSRWTPRPSPGPGRRPSRPDDLRRPGRAQTGPARSPLRPAGRRSRCRGQARRAQVLRAVFLLVQPSLPHDGTGGACRT